MKDILCAVTLIIPKPQATHSQWEETRVPKENLQLSAECRLITLLLSKFIEYLISLSQQPV
jgi:hypothetical protein